MVCLWQEYLQPGSADIAWKDVMAKMLGCSNDEEYVDLGQTGGSMCERACVHVRVRVRVEREPTA